MKVYVVVSGYHDDYDIEEIFLLEENAEKYCNYMNSLSYYNKVRDYRIEEHITKDNKVKIIENNP